MRLETAQFDGLPTFVQVNSKAGLSEVGGCLFWDKPSANQTPQWSDVAFCWLQP